MALDFNFFQQWYPILPIRDFKKDQPTAVTILGVRLVIWKPRLSETYRVFLDQCPHRLAPLSEVGISIPENPKINDNRQELLDHYRQHTQHCSSCLGLFKIVQRIQWMVLGYSIITVSVAAILPDDLRVKIGLPLIVLALLGLGFYSLLKLWLSPKYYLVDYILQLSFIQPSIRETSK